MVVPGAWFKKKASGVGRAQRRWFELNGVFAFAFERALQNERVVACVLLRLAVCQATAYAVRPLGLFYDSGASIWYFEGENDGRGIKKKGSIDVGAGTTASASGSLLNITDPDGRTWELVADDESTAADWEALIYQAQNKQKHRFKERLTELTDAGKDHSEIETELFTEFGNSILTTNHASIVAAAAASGSARFEEDEAEDEASRKGERSAWFVKKAEKFGSDKRRYFVLSGVELKYYADAVDGYGVDHRGTIALGLSCSIIRSGKRFLFCFTRNSLAEKLPSLIDFALSPLIGSGSSDFFLTIPISFLRLCFRRLRFSCCRGRNYNPAER